MSTFGERLHDAMVLRGETIASVSAHCHVSRQTVAKWLIMHTAQLAGTHLDALGEFLQTRTHWLVTGAGSPTPISLALDVRDIVEMAELMATDQRQSWLAIARKMLGKKA